GNWSFGDYFKEEAIAWSWELLTEVYKIQKDRLYVTVFEGDTKEGLPKDEEAFNFWKKYVAEDHILLGNKKDNFWEMGETGPCGPCSEIHFDNRTDAERSKVNGSTLVNYDDPQVIEIWNNVFIQFNRLKDGSLQQLPAKHVDTGMGLERLVRVLQNKTSNYDTDVFQPLIQFISKESKKPYLSEATPGDKGWNEAVAMRVMADHIRAISFCIADGTLPSSKEAGYVIRRILRRAVRYSYQYLGFEEPFLNKLVPILADQFDGIFPELKTQQNFVQKVVLEEEKAFLKTLDLGTIFFESFIKNGEGYIEKGLVPSITISGKQHSSGKSERIVPGSFAFELSDTHGFPLDLTELMAREKGWTVDVIGFNKALEQQKTRSRAATAIDTADWVVLKNDDTVEFTGYDETETITHVVKYRKVTSKGKEQFQLVLDKTPFYAESGGQVGDTGDLVFPDGEVVHVTDTKKENGLIVHYVDKIPEDIDDALTAIVDPERRASIMNNHSATHLLHAALKQVLGSHVNQKGSLVNADYLRFDFSHFSKVTDEELSQIEAIVNQKIRENIQLDEQRNVPYQEAINSGVTALFGEKYGDFVRMITFNAEFSRELCGGTHVKATGHIGYLKIISESAVAAGVRRIEAISGEKAEEYINEQNKLVNDLKNLLKNPKDLAKSVESLLEENTRLKKEIERSLVEKSAGLKHELAAKAKIVNGISIIAEKVSLPNAEAIKNLAYALKDIVSNLFLVLAADIDGKPSLTVMIAENLVKERNLNAGNIVRELAKEIGGSGGGQPFYATAGGKDVSGLNRALEKARSFIS
ncbi:MAG TPA: alanine--tRNA ligase, partial [Sphingobacteriaceae bacterium]|nr:alanine--tRNA ligase [Sphingobacteriaceae bacterium]